MTTISAHQPNLLPWIGHFAKLAQADVHVFFTTPIAPNGKSYLNRVRIAEDRWLTMPITRAKGQRIYEVPLLAPQASWQRILRQIEATYRKAPFFDEVWPAFSARGPRDVDTLSTFNSWMIANLAYDLLGGKAPVFECAHVHPDLAKSKAAKTEAIVETLLAFGATRYIAGRGKSLEFLEPELFAKAGVELVFQDFEDPHGGLSVIDALMTRGFCGTAELLTAKVAA